MNELIISTELLHSNKEHDLYGKYIEERKKIDYTYYSNYTKERQLFQDTLIANHFIDKKISNHPWIIYTCGCYGAGKSHSLKQLQFNIKDMVYVDPDKIKLNLPEAEKYIKEDSLNANNALHKEATFIATLIEYYALNHEYTIIVDGSLQNYHWYQSHFQEILTHYQKYKIAIIKVTADITIIKERCKKREKETGIIIPDQLLESIYQQIPIAFEKLLPFAHLIIEITNNDSVFVDNVRIHPSIILDSIYFCASLI